MVLLLCIYFVLIPHAISQIIPAQTYSIYQQNGLANPSASQPSNNAPYPQDVTVQSQIQPSNIPPSTIRQILLNKIISDASSQGNLDPNLYSYGGISPGNAYQMSPSPANNYFAMPTEYKANNTNVNTEISDSNVKEKSKSKKRRRKSKRKQENGQNKLETSTIRTVDSKKNKENNSSNDKSAKKRSKTQPRDKTTSKNESKDTKIEQNKETTPRKRKNKNNSSTTPKPTENTTENTRPKKRKRKPKLENNNTKTNVTKQTTQSNKLSGKETITPALNEDKINKDAGNTESPNRDTNDLKVFPNVPGQFAPSLFTGFPIQYNNPEINDFFAKYYQSILNNNNNNNNGYVDNINMNQRKPKNKKNSKPKNNEKNSNSTEQILVTNKDNKNAIVTTEKTNNINEKVSTDIDSKPIEKKDDNINTEPQTDKIEIKNPENDTEIYENNYYGYIDDYYPTFMDSAAYANNKHYHVKNINDENIITTTAKTNNEPITTSSIKEYEHIKQKLKDLERDRLIHKTQEEESIRNIYKNKVQDIDNEVITFKTPPVLEMPDFFTRQIDKTEIIPDVYYHPEAESSKRFVGDKSKSTKPHRTSDKNLINTKDKTNIETVFAKSKVVKYSPVYVPEEESLYYPKIDDFFQDGGTVYVMAKSLNDPEVFY